MHKGLISDSASNQLDSLESHFNSVSIGKMRGLEQIKGCRPFGGGKEILFILLKPGECVFVVEVGGAGFPFRCASKPMTENTQLVWPPQEFWRFVSKTAPLVMWQVRSYGLGHGVRTAVSSANEFYRSQEVKQQRDQGKTLTVNEISVLSK